MTEARINELFTTTDINTGEDIYYVDKELRQPFNGHVVDCSKGIISWEFDVKDGYRTGKEKMYYDTGELMVENDMDHNTVNGVSKEFFKDGKIKSIGVAIRNVFIDLIVYNELGDVVDKKSIDKNSMHYSLVEDEIQDYRDKYMI